MKNEQRDVRLAQAGDVDAFERLYHLHLPRVHRIARWLLGTNDVDDVIQEVFLRIWDRLETFDERSSLVQLQGVSFAITLSKQTFLLMNDVLGIALQKRLSGSALGTWLHRVAVNVILRHRERAARYRAQEVHLEDERCEERGERPGLRLDLEAAVSSLPERARTVFVLHEIQGYSHHEIAKLMNTSVVTSRTQLHRAREIMRAQFRDVHT